LGDVRQVPDDALTRPYAKLAEPGRDGTHLSRIGRPGQLGEGLVLAEVQQRGGTGPLLPQDVLAVVEPCAREPFGTRHLTAPEHPAGRSRRLDLEVVPDRSPEAL